jgi:hypothetical protein
MGNEEEEDDDNEEEGGSSFFNQGFMDNAMRTFKEQLGSNSQEAKKMDKNEPDTVEILLRRAENGFVVEVDYPRRMIPNPQLEGVQSIFSTLGKMANQPPEGHDHSAFMKTIGDTIAKAAKPSKPIRKPHEEYVFQSMETMIAFIKETLESAEAADNAAPTK